MSEIKNNGRRALGFWTRGVALIMFGVLNLSMGFAFAQSENGASQQVAPQYINFLDLLPLALENDDGIKAAKLNYDAALESERASRSGLYPKADAINHAEQNDSAAPLTTSTSPEN